MTSEFFEFLKGYDQTLTVLFIFLTMIAGAFGVWAKLREKMQEDLRLQREMLVKRQDDQRDRFLRDFEHWYQIAQTAFNEIGTLKLQINALMIHVQNLENTMTREGIEIPERPDAIQELYQ